MNKLFVLLWIFVALSVSMVPVLSATDKRLTTVKLFDSYTDVLARSSPNEIHDNGDRNVTWIYNYSGYKYEFVLDPDGRVIEILCVGNSYGSISASKVKLGSLVDKVYQRYGWADKTAEQDDNIVLIYRKHGLKFYIHNTNNKLVVVGVSSFIKE